MALMNLAMDDAYNRRRWGQGLFDQQRTGANPYFGGGASVRANSTNLMTDNTKDIYQHGLPFGVGGYNPNNPRYASLNKNPNYEPNAPDSTQAYLQNKYFDQPMRDVELQNAQLGLNTNLLTAPSVAGEQRSAFERGQALSALYGLKPEEGGISGRYSTQGGTGVGSQRSFIGALPKVGAKPLSATDVATMGAPAQSILASAYAPKTKAETALDVAQMNWDNRFAMQNYKSSDTYKRMTDQQKLVTDRNMAIQKEKYLSQGFDMARHQSIITSLQDADGNVSQQKYEQEYENIPYADRLIIEGQYGVTAPVKKQAPQTAPGGTTKTAPKKPRVSGIID